MNLKNKCGYQEILDEYCVDYRIPGRTTVSTVKKELPTKMKGSSYDVPKIEDKKEDPFVTYKCSPQITCRASNPILGRCVAGTILLLIIFVSVGFISTILFEQISYIASMDVFSLGIGG